MWQKFIAKCDRYYRVRQKFLHIVTGITKCDKNLLQSVKDTTKCVNFYKVRGKVNHPGKSD